MVEDTALRYSIANSQATMALGMGAAPRGLRQCNCGGVWGIETGLNSRRRAIGKWMGTRGVNTLGPAGCHNFQALAEISEGVAN
eukprot:4242501-Pyramimonas_sp.AAC.1